MISIDKDAKLAELGFGLLLTIHDEVMGECPVANAEEAAKRLAEIMINTAKENNIKVPMSCDPSICSHWLEDECMGVLNEEYSKCLDKCGGDEEKAYSKLLKSHPELLESQIHGVLKEHKDHLFDWA